VQCYEIDTCNVYREIDSESVAITTLVSRRRISNAAARGLLTENAVDQGSVDGSLSGLAMLEQQIDSKRRRWLLLAAASCNGRNACSVCDSQQQQQLVSSFRAKR
jgi:hypothetical protein